MKSSLTLLGALLALGSIAAAGQQNYGVGSQAVTWLNLPDSARASAMGDAGAALGGDVSTLSVNPAGLSSLGGQQVALMHDSYVLDLSLEHFAYGLDLGPNDGIAAGLEYMNYGAVQGYTVNNATLSANGSFNPYGLSGELGYGHAFGAFSAGLGVKMVGESLGVGGVHSALGADAGLQWRQNPGSGLSAGFAVQNFGTQLDQSNLPTNLQGGLAYRLPLRQGTQCLTLAGDASVPTADAASEALSLGLEYAGDGLWALRGGYDFVGNNGIGGLSVGGGLTYGNFGIDYAFVTEGALGYDNRIALTARFAGPARDPAAAQAERKPAPEDPFAAAQAAFDAKDYAAAARLFGGLQDTDPRIVEARTKRGMALYALKDYQGAEAAFVLAAAGDGPWSRKAGIYLGQLRKKMKRKKS
jgi:hypothetical protein